MISTSTRYTSTMRTFMTFALFLAACSLSTAQSPTPNRQWVLTLGDRTLLILSINPTSSQSRPVSGSLARPRHFQTSDASSFSHISGPIEIAPIVNSAWKGSALSITIKNPSDPDDKDIFLMTFKDGAHAQLQYDGFPLPPMDLTRAEGVSLVSTDWDKDKIYSPDDGRPPNPEMKRIFEEDQRVCQPGKKIDWTPVNKSDVERRQAVTKLLNVGLLHTGEDFQRAAFVFQHGSTPDDYLFAHTLAFVALKKGSVDRDRRLRPLLTVHQTAADLRYSIPYTQNQPTSQNPYNRVLISDSFRRQLGVPTQAAQDAQRKQYDTQRGIRK